MKIGMYEKKIAVFIFIILFGIGLFAWGVSEIGHVGTDWTRGLFGGGLIAAAVAIFIVGLSVYQK